MILIKCYQNPISRNKMLVDEYLIGFTHRLPITLNATANVIFWTINMVIQRPKGRCGQVARDAELRLNSIYAEVLISGG